MSPDITTEGGFMVSRRVVTAAVAVIVPFAVVNALVISDSAAVTPVKAAGSITCHYGTTVTFNPPLSRSPGTLVHASTTPSEVVTLARATLGTCTRTPSGTPAVSGGRAVATFTAKIPGTSLGGGKWYVGSCLTFQEMAWAKISSQFAWSGPKVPLANSAFATKTTALSRTAGRLGFIASGTATGSFAGAKSSITAYFNAPSAKAISAICGGSTAKIATATTSSTLSTIHLGST